MSPATAHRPPGRPPTPPADPRIDVYGLDAAGLADLVAGLGAPPYRARQIRRWLYRGLATSFAQMTDLPTALRAQLDDVARIGALETVLETASDDGMAVKFLFRLSDGQLIETVLMHYVDPADEAETGDVEGSAVDDGAASTARPGRPPAAVDVDDVPASPVAVDDASATPASAAPSLPIGRHTVCLSTQAGCAMGCVFCATGQMGLLRNLTRAECVAQVLHCARLAAGSGERIGNVVFMGMGEPLANWEATWGAVETFVDPDGFGLSPRRLTISTVGIVPGILRLAAEPLPIRLAVSVHAADDALRGRLVAVNETYPLAAIVEACHAYQAAGHRRITFEVVLIHGVNDAPEQAALLAERLRGLRGHVNLIPLNPTPGTDLQPSRYDDAVRFQKVLRAAGFPTTLRMRRGIEISAGCGQLRSRASEGRMGRTIPRPAVVEAGAL